MFLQLSVFCHPHLPGSRKICISFGNRKVELYRPELHEVRGTRTCLVQMIKSGPEPLENEINKILGSKREDRFSDHLSDLVQNICSFRFSYQLCLSLFCKAPRDVRKFPQKCQKIAGGWESAVYGSRPPIASKPDSSPPERPGLDNFTSQP